MLNVKFGSAWLGVPPLEAKGACVVVLFCVSLVCARIRCETVAMEGWSKFRGHSLFCCSLMMFWISSISCVLGVVQCFVSMAGQSHGDFAPLGVTNHCIFHVKKTEFVGRPQQRYWRRVKAKCHEKLARTNPAMLQVHGRPRRPGYSFASR